MKHSLTSRHLTTLAESAISAEAAHSWGVRTIQDPLDLPGGLKDSKLAQRSVPGVLFPLRRLDGSVTFQLRPDNPPADDEGRPRKYIQEFGVGAIINVPESMADRTESATTVLIVEGTKQTIAVSQYVDTDTLVVGIQGCANWSVDGRLHPDLATLCADAARVEILFDADVGKNDFVWDAAKSLRDALTGQAMAQEVAFARLHYDANNPHASTAGVRGQTAGIDDVLGGLGENSRADFLAHLRAHASTELGPKPKPKKRPRTPAGDAANRATATGTTASVTQIVDGTSSTIEIDHDTGTTVRITHNANGEDTTDVLYPVAAEIIVEEVIERQVHDTFERTGMNYTLKVSAAQPGGRVAHTELDIPASRLEKVNDWLNDTGPVTRAVPRFPKPGEQIEFANLVRAASNNVEHVRRVDRLGWVFDHDDPDGPQYRWLFPGGGIGAHTTSRTIYGMPAASMFNSIDMPHPDDVTPEQLKEAIDKFVGARNLLRDDYAVAWDANVGAFGLSFLPVAPMTAVAFFGKKSSGKSTLAQALAGMLSSRWMPRKSPMWTFNSSPAAMDIIASGVHNCFLHVDDLKPESDPRRRSQVFAMLDDLLRRAHNSGGKGRGGIDSSGGVIVRERDDSSPLLLLTGEEIPTGGEFAESGLDRMFVVTTPSDGVMRRRDGDSGDAAYADFETATEHFRLITPIYVQWIARMLQQAEQFSGSAEGALDVLRSEVGERTTDIAARIAQSCKAAGVSITSRGVTSAARLVVGVDYFADFLDDMGLMEESDAMALVEQALEAITAQAISNAVHVMGGNVDSGAEILERLRSAIAQGRATIDKGDLRSGCTRIGQLGKATTNGQQVEVVNLNPDAVVTITRWSTGRAGVIRDLGTMSVPGDDGRALRNASIAGQKMRVISVRADAWGITSDDDASEDTEAGDF